jgi:putative flippase GtrA
MKMPRFLYQRFPAWEHAWNEMWSIFKFGVVGVTSLALNTAMYALLSRVVWPDGNRTLESVMAVLFASIYNFTMHKIWTFGAKQFNGAMLLRYAVVVVIGSGLSGSLFFVGHELLHIYDFAVLIGSAFIVAGATYFLHKLFTFQAHKMHIEVQEPSTF